MVPSTQVAIDEMVVLFYGRSHHKMPNKPISQGYKIYALYDHGYTYNFTFNSPTSEYCYVRDHNLGFSPTLNVVYNLATPLPYTPYGQLFQQFTLI